MQVVNTFLWAESPTRSQACMGQSMQQVRSYSAQQALGHSECMYRHVWLPHSRVGQNIQIKPALAVVHNIVHISVGWPTLGASTIPCGTTDHLVHQIDMRPETAELLKSAHDARQDASIIALLYTYDCSQAPFPHGRTGAQPATDIYKRTDA